MKKAKKLMAVVLALMVALTMGIATSSVIFAADGDLADGSIQITPPTGVAADATNTYKIYKVFDATNSGTVISYKIDSQNGELTAAMTAAGFSVDSAGNVSGPATLDANAIAAIAAYAKHKVAEVTATGAAPVTATNLGAGYYYITTTTGTVVTIDSTNPSAAVNDKNTVPSVDKKITGANSIDENGKKALAQVGTTVNYSAEITVGEGAKGYVFHDTMETGLKYNGDAAIKDATKDTDYTVGKEGDDTFTITIDDDYIKTLAVGSKITVTYSATVTSDAITTDPLNNTCYVNYGDKNSNNKTPDSSADVYEAKFTVTKKDGNGAPLANAGFVIKNASGAYYKTTAGADGPVVSWYTLETDETLAAAIAAGKVTEYKSDAQGAVAPFKGLANGTYTLEESTVPPGYNKADDQTFTVAEHNYTAANLEQKASVTNNAGSELPSTGGIGTTIFYILGALLVIGCGIVLIARRRLTAK